MTKFPLETNADRDNMTWTFHHFPFAFSQKTKYNLDFKNIN